MESQPYGGAEGEGGSDSDGAVEEVSIAQGRLDSERKRRDERAARQMVAADAKEKRRKRGQKSEEAKEDVEEGSLTKRRKSVQERVRMRKGSTSGREEEGAEAEEQADGGGGEGGLVGMKQLKAKEGGNRSGRGKREAIIPRLPDEVLQAIAEQERTAIAAEDEGNAAKQVTRVVSKKKKTKSKGTNSRSGVEKLPLAKLQERVSQPPSKDALQFRNSHLYGTRVERSLRMLPASSVASLFASPA